MKVNSVKKGTLVFLENAVRNLPQYIFWKDTQSVYLGCNNSYAKLLGLTSPAEIVGRTDLDIGWLPDGDSAELFRQGDAATMAGELIINQEEWLSLPNGNKVLVLVNKGPIYDDENQLLGVLGVATDITEKKKIEQELQETHHKLQGMTLVSASLAHELRTPLTTIGLGLRGLKRYLPYLVEGYQMAQRAGFAVPMIGAQNFKILEDLPVSLESVTQASFMVIDMLLMNVKASIEASSSEIFSISACIREALAQYPFDENQRQRVHYECANDFDVQGQSTLVKHVFFNLIKNALHYIASEKKGDIYIWLEKNEDINWLYFKDTGVGIAKDVLPYIFDRFFSRTYHGAGIGLTFCKAVMESLGGTITCESEQDIYTQFKLSFPLPKDKELIER